MRKYGHNIVIRRGACYDTITAPIGDIGDIETVDMSHVKANVRQVIVDTIIGRLEANGFFKSTSA